MTFEMMKHFRLFKKKYEEKEKYKFNIWLRVGVALKETFWFGHKSDHWLRAWPRFSLFFWEEEWFFSIFLLLYCCSRESRPARRRQPEGGGSQKVYIYMCVCIKYSFVPASAACQGRKETTTQKIESEEHLCCSFLSYFHWMSRLCNPLSCRPFSYLPALFWQHFLFKKPLIQIELDGHSGCIFIKQQTKILGQSLTDGQHEAGQLLNRPRLRANIFCLIKKK